MAQVRVDRLQGATFVELFFDLVFVYAVTQLTSFVLHDLTWAGVGRAAVLFWLVWWAWTQFTWTLNEADTEHSGIRLATLAATAVAFFLAQGLPDAFGDAGAWFAGAYVASRLIGLAVQGWVFRDDVEQAPALRLWSLASMVGLALVVAGGLVDGDGRLVLWVAAIVADLLAATMAGRGSWQLEPGHFVERHGLIVIIALGESLIAAGVASAEVTRDATFAFATAGAVVGACALWWTYFGSAHAALEEVMHGHGPLTRGQFARDVFSFGHAAIVAGVIGVAIGFEEAVAHPQDAFHTEVALAFCLGAILFVGGTGAVMHRAGLRTTLGSRLGFVVLALAGLPALSRVPAGVSLWGLAVLAAVLALVESPARGRVALPA